MQARAHYLYELGEVQRALLQLGEAAEHLLARALRAFQYNDIVAARLVIQDDDEIDERRADIEHRVLHLIAAQQPLASDLRFLLATLRIADELERIGDYAAGIARLVMRDPAEPPLVPPADLPVLSEQVRSVLRASVEAFVARDASMAIRLEHADDHIDKLAMTIRIQIQHYLQDTPISATRALYCLFVTHNLERIADRAIDIAERTRFIVTGKLPKRRFKGGYSE